MKYEFLAHIEECFYWARVDGYCFEYDFRKAELAVEALAPCEIQEFLSRQDESATTWEVIEDFDYYCRVVLDCSIRK